MLEVHRLDDRLLEGNETVVIVIDADHPPAGESAGATATNTGTLVDGHRADRGLAPAALDVTEGARASDTGPLAHRPTGPVTVRVASDNAGVTLDTDPNTAGEQATRTCTTARSNARKG